MAVLAVLEVIQTSPYSCYRRWDLCWDIEKTIRETIQVVIIDVLELCEVGMQGLAKAVGRFSQQSHRHGASSTCRGKEEFCNSTLKLSKISKIVMKGSILLFF